ncbi:MAG: 23S rRNA (adenine(1618)-N(6))-methyltransferase RlmF [Flavobacterium sp.]|nr:MAG: 23S rRNA (adenine(1618)-N(6))-methyltransferase RlmF [Flavobacterium sp.]
MVQEKVKLHPESKYRHGYDFSKLIKANPDLAPFVHLNEYGKETINFSDPIAVKALNKALLMHYYNISFWDIPNGYLCPPIPGRADYIYYLADILAEANQEIIPRGKFVKGLDIGMGANCIYPIIGNAEYGWSFTGSDIDKKAIRSARLIIESNRNLDSFIECRLQSSSANVFTGLIKSYECFDFTVCNPPFHASLKDAEAGTLRKLRNLHGKKGSAPVLNFGGQNAELWCEGGEAAFVRKMIEQSAVFSKNVLWFTTLISKKENLPKAYSLLKYLNAVEVKTVNMSQGQKVSRILVWTFLSKEEQVAWRESRWKKAGVSS